MYRSQYFEGGRALTGAISAIDIALHDIVGKALNVPVYQLLGGKQRDAVPCFATTGAATLEELIANANLLLENGWNVIRTNVLHRAKPGEENIFEPRESISLGRRMVDSTSRSHRIRTCPRYRLSSPAQRCGSGIFLSTYALRPT